MKVRDFFLIAAFVGMSSQANAAGETVTLLGTVQDSVLGGYVATLPLGWLQEFTFGVATPSTTAAASVQFYAVNVPYTNSTSTPTTLPPRSQITRMSNIGTVLTRELIPAAAQVVLADCKLPRFTGFVTNDGCPTLGVSVTPLKALAGRLLVTAYKQGFNIATNSYSYKTWVYVYDPAATLAADKWVLLDARTTSTTIGIATNFLTLDGAYTPADLNVYVFRRPTSTSTSINSVAAK